MKLTLPLKFWLILVILNFSSNFMFGQNSNKGKITGSIKIDKSWSSAIYLSYIPTFEDIRSISSEMIIATSPIDSLGHFELDISFLPTEQKLYRLHITKKSDSKTSLIIGGLNENYFVFIASRNSKIAFKTSSSVPPFKTVIFKPQDENFNFQEITTLVFDNERVASKSGFAKRNFMEEKLNEELLNIADSSSNALVSLYAIYQSSFESNYSNNEKFYKSYLKKWSKQDNNYFKEFRKKLPLKEQSDHTTRNILLSLALIIVGFIIGKYGFPKTNRMKKLSVQERKIFILLQNGATNKEIADEFNIGISTVKSHVSSILNKLNIKSRKEIMNLT